MNKHLFHYTFTGIIITTLAGALLHFAYDFSNQNPLVAMFTPVNESTWEHMKLVFFPVLVYIAIGLPFFGKSNPTFLQAYLTGLLTGTFSVIIIFYTYTGILGRHYLFLDILTFCACIIIAFCISYQLTIQNCRLIPLPVIAFMTILLMVCFFFFTFFPPHVALFTVFPSK